MALSRITVIKSYCLIGKQIKLDSVEHTMHRTMNPQSLVLTPDQKALLESLENECLPSKLAAADRFGVQLRQIQEDCQLLRKTLNSPRAKVFRFVKKGEKGLDGKSLQALFLFRSLVTANWKRRAAAEAVRKLIVFTGI